MKIKSLLFTITFLFIINTGYAQTCARTSLVEKTPTERFIQDDASGTVYDTATALTWMRCSIGQQWDSENQQCTGAAQSHTWRSALQYVRSLNQGDGYASQHDWRVPNIKELGSIVETQCYGPAINLEIFPNTQSYFYWSSTYASNFTPNIHYIDFDRGHHDKDRRATDSGYVRLVRDDY